MECSICHRRHDAQKMPFLCPVDARNNIYQGRMKNLQLILEIETLKGQIDKSSADSSASSSGGLEQSLARQCLTEDRADQILAAAQKLREEIKAAREEIRSRKAALARRRSDFASVSDGLVQRRVKQQQELDKSAQMLRFRWAQKTEATANTRAFLCTEALKLYGLGRTKEGGSGRYNYHLGKVPIIDLAGMDCVFASDPHLLCSQIVLPLTFQKPSARKSYRHLSPMWLIFSFSSVTISLSAFQPSSPFLTVTTPDRLFSISTAPIDIAKFHSPASRDSHHHLLLTCEGLSLSAFHDPGPCLLRSL